MRKEMIQKEAATHKSRGVYDNAMCRTAIEKNIYATAWANA